MSMTVSVRTEYVNAKKYDFQRKHDKRENKRTPHYINKDLSKNNEVIEFVPVNGRELAELNDLQRRKMIDEGKSPLKVKKENNAGKWYCLSTGHNLRNGRAGVYTENVAGETEGVIPCDRRQDVQGDEHENPIPCHT